MVAQPLGGVDAWVIRYCQTERGGFRGEYNGAALPNARDPCRWDLENGTWLEHDLTENLLAEPSVY